MRPVSQRFLDSLRYSHLFRTDAQLTQPGDAGPVPLDLIDGTVTLDRTAQQRARATLVIPEMNVSTNGSEVVIRTGLVYPDQTEELVTVATLRVDDVKSSDADAKTTLTCVDRSQTIADTSLIDPVAFEATDSLEGAIVQLVSDVFPAISTTTPGHADVFGKATVVDHDRMAAINEWSKALGCDAYFDADGDFVLADVPAFSDAAVWIIDTGTEGVLVDYDRTDTRRGVYNAVKASGQPVDGGTPPVSYLAVDDDPSSSTYWDGPFGKVPFFMQSESITTAGQVQRAAEAVLATFKGVAVSVSLGSVPNPALEPDDAVAVIRQNGQRERHLIDSLTIPLTTRGGAMSLGTRAA